MQLTVEPIDFRRSTNTFVREIGVKAADKTSPDIYTEGSILYEYFEIPSESSDGPQAFEGNLGPHSLGAAHFHPVDQFQIFFGPCDGYYQREDLDDVLVHYADAFTTYGPFGSRDNALRFCSLRRNWTDLTHYMPGSKDALPAGVAHRNRTYKLPDRDRRLEVMGGHAESETIQLGLETDGTGAWLVIAGPNATFDIPDTAGQGGMYIVPLDGDLLIKNASYAARDIGWVAPNTVITEPARSGDSGLQALFLRFRS